MAVQDLWMKRDANGKKVRSARYGRGKRWRVVVENPDTGKAVTEAYDTEKEAEDRDAILRADILRGTYVDAKAGKILVSDYANAWKADLLHSPSTRQRVEWAISCHIEPTALGRRPMAAVRSSTIKAWVKDRSEVLAPSTLRVLYGGVVVPMFTQAVVDRVLGLSPCVGIRLPEIEDSEYFIPPVQKVYDLADALPRQFRPVPLLAAGLGWRGGEIFGAEVSDDQARNAVDFLRRLAHVRQQVIKVNGRPAFLAPPKSKQSRRTNEMPDQVGECLAEHLATYEPVAVRMMDHTKPRSPVERDVRLMIATLRHTPMYHGKWAHVWPAAVKKVGLPEGFGLHGLRHFYATALIAGGASVKSVQLAMGHAKPSITLDRYIGYWPDALGSLRSLMNSALKAA